jgi:signal peptidase I
LFIQEPAPKEASAPPLRQNKLRRVLLRCFVIALAIACTRTFIGEVALVPTSSMEGTILVGDHILLNKSLYGPQVPFTGLHLPRLRSVKKGEIVAFHYPRDPKLIFLKRVVAVGGETVELRDDVLYVNGIAQREPYIVHSLAPWMRAAAASNMRIFNVPKGELFVLGDNRDNSDDSRYWGSVPAGNVIGEPILICWSYDAPSRAWLDENPWRSARFYASMLVHFFPRTRWTRTGELLR